ncbi:hypothetical protein [Streptomyces sp. NPDC057557]|uniref:hypothetical protein n=1 Tax=Streptomyces sp. NPDC057557 TaxID=3346167 RepID=UPI0036B874B1
MAERKFLDCDGDTWTEYEPGMLRLTERANGNFLFLGTESSVEDTARVHGPLTEIRPDVDIRALLADVLEELAEELRRSTDLPRVLDATAKRMREESA